MEMAVVSDIAALELELETLALSLSTGFAASELEAWKSWELSRGLLGCRKRRFCLLGLGLTIHNCREIYLLTRLAGTRHIKSTVKEHVLARPV